MLVRGTIGFTLLVAAVAAGSACAMTTSSSERLNCTVEGTSNLPNSLGGQPGICAIIENAVSSAIARGGIPLSAISVAVEVKSQSRMSAVVTFNGKALPEQDVASSDRALNAVAVKMLANALAAEISKSAQASGGHE
jgi:hypothetical protein